MKKIPTETAMTIPTPPWGNRMASGGPRRMKMMHATEIAYFLWISTRCRAEERR